ncbi:MAG: ABC transporter ATP-binding protein [Leptolyngbya sp. SIO1E4]|nr:ABC transporter ATP-binding protein [Leptolyngbya sp. SIO1E4]
MTDLRLEGITKRFGDFVANEHINLSVETGSIHAVLGENGAGKTTLMNILSGLYQPDAGHIFLDDRPVQIESSQAAIAHGIGMIHQHFMLVPSLTVTENIVLGAEAGLPLRRAAKEAEIAALSQTYGLAVPPDARVEDLPVGVQQRVEILKVLYRRAKILILDEPTAVLTPTEVGSLLRLLRQLATQQHTIIFISHKLDEVMTLCDTVTVLRRGQVAATVATQACTHQDLARLMVGRDVSLTYDKPPTSGGDTVLSVQDLWVRNRRGLPAVRGVSFELKAGEILGIAGVDGNGQRELADAIACLTPIERGRLSLTPGCPLGYIPEDRQKMGLILRFSIARNLILKAFRWRPFARWGWLQRREIDRNANTAIQAFDIRAIHHTLSASQLSGGNQQKVVLARELSGNPGLIIAMQPTRGLDIGATEYVQRALLEQRQRGAAILYISTELEEVMAMGDRIAVMYEGQFVDILTAATATTEKLGLLMAGGTPVTVDETAANPDLHYPMGVNA